jgi:hypothetical protein
MTQTTDADEPAADPFADLRRALAHVSNHLNGSGEQDDLNWALRRIEEDVPVLLALAQQRADLEADNKELREQLDSLRDTTAALAPILQPLWDVARKQVMSLWRALAPFLEPASPTGVDGDAATAPEPDDDGYAALAASESDEDRAFHAAVRRRRRDRD